MTTRTFKNKQELQMVLLQGEKWELKHPYEGICIYDNLNNMQPFRFHSFSGDYAIDKAYDYCDSKTLWHKVEEMPKHLPEGTICWVEVNKNSKSFLRVADGNGEFYINGYRTSADTYPYNHYEPIEMGLQFSEDIIKTKNITPDMNKQLALCWSRVEVAYRSLRVIDAKNKCTFWNDGDKGGFAWDNYRLCTTPYPNLPQWAKDMIDACEN